MLFNKLVIAAFVALVHQVSAAPVELQGRTYRFPVYSSNDGNVFVSGSAKGGNGGTNNAYNEAYAAPVVQSWGSGGKIFQPVTQTNVAHQSADGGSAVVGGVMSRDFEERGYSFPVYKTNDHNVAVVGHATGGNGGTNNAENYASAEPQVWSSGKFGTIFNGASQSNTAVQGANGGPAMVAGVYHSRGLHEVETRHLADELEARGWTFPSYSSNDGNVAVYGTAKGGKGGTNNAANYAIAKPVVLSDGGHSTIYNGVSQGNYVGQSADGGSAAVIGVGKRDGLVERTACSTSNDWNTFVKGTATGGNGGINNANNVNAAIPIVISDGKGGYITQTVSQGNTANQQANGGSAAVIGKSY